MTSSNVTSSKMPNFKDVDAESLSSKSKDEVESQTPGTANLYTHQVAPGSQGIEILLTISIQK